MTDAEQRGVWHVLENGIVLNEETDPETGATMFYQLQSTRPLEPHDLRSHDERALAHAGRLKVLLVLGLVGRLVLIVCIVAVVAGVVLYQFDATEAVGSIAFWLGIPIGVLSWVLGLVATWRMTSGIQRIQRDAGLAPGMVDEIDHERGLALIETHGLSFRTERVTGQQRGYGA